MRAFLNWLFPRRVNEDRTILHQLYWATRGCEDKLLDGISPMNQAWIDRNSNS